jgi:PAS domain S-box-containing protein
MTDDAQTIERLARENAELRRQLEGPRGAPLGRAETPSRTEIELRRQEQRLRLILDGVRDHAISMLDPEGRVETFNAPAARIKGYALEEVRGRYYGMFFTPEDRAGGLPERELEVARGGGRYEGEGWRLRKDGSLFYAMVSMSALRDASGELVGFVKVTQDITEQREAREVQDRVQRRLVVAERMASVGTLAAGVAHEINNPLAYVTTNLDMVLEEIRAISGGSASGRMRELEDMVRSAQEGAERVRKIVRGLKTFSRADAECRTVTDLREVLELSINMAFNEIRHRARLVKDYGAAPLVEADDARLGQVFINLLVNAAQALPDGGAEAHEIRVTTSTDAGGRAVVEVRDSGPGIAPAVLDRIFDPFFTTKAPGLGTGLGLSICHNIVTGMGGEITVESRVGYGTTFRVALPAASGLPLQAPGERVSGGLPPSRRAVVLVVDDEPAVGVMIARVLRQHDVTVVARATEAIALLAAGREFDVILTDLMMPVMSGMELYDDLARRFPAAAERLVFLTGGAFTPAASAFLERVSNERLEKPFKPSELRALVEQFVR